MGEPNKESSSDRITFRGPGGREETYTREELTEQWNLIQGLRNALKRIKPVGRWMKRPDSIDSQEGEST